jgi:hypothetical protein
MHEAEMSNLRNQIEDSQRQTGEIAKQTRYIMWAFIFTAISSLLGLALQLCDYLSRNI